MKTNDPYELWQLEKYGNILPPDETGTLAPNLTDEQKAAWFESEAEKQRMHDEQNFPSHDQFTIFK